MTAPDNATVSRTTGGSPGEAPGPRPYLFLALACDRPLSGSARVALRDLDELQIGRGGDAPLSHDADPSARRLSLRVPDDSASVDHALLKEHVGRWRIEDRGSKNGTFVNGRRCQSADLSDGDIIELGRTFFVYRVIEAIADRAAVLASPSLPPSPAGFVTLNPALAARFDDVGRIARTDAPVLVTGPSGTGKELTARAIHELSRRAGDIVAVNCGGLPRTLLEAELFGHEKSAFTGADRARPGLVRAAEGGTLFLDEIGDLPPEAQAVLLRVLQQREVVPVGGTTPVPVDFRLVGATHRDLEAMVERDAFREDLLARLTGFSIELPALSRRREDLGLIVAALLRHICGDGADAIRLSVDAARALLSYAWPRNVRELENALRAAIALADGDAIRPPHLPESVRAPQSAADTPADDGLRAQLIELLHRHDGNVAAVARALGTTRAQIHRYARRFAIDFADYRPGRR